MAATTDQQISLAIAQRGNSSHLNKHARQLVPAFLQKLYEITNNPANQDLIRWSDTGDSFFVLDQERFASEVLGRWFKHNRFSTFVRQLNMYGFHKIPHLQQGVLRSDSDAELWHYEHPHFLRGRPDMLCLIRRRKPVAGDGAPATAIEAAAGSGAVGALSANRLSDITSIVNGIQAIKRHQATISADLNELKGSSQHLWQETMVARERHKKHQDTINRILKFLAGVFGNGDGQMREDEDASRAVVARNPQRLLIANGRTGQKARVSEAAEERSRSSVESARSTSSTGFFASLDMSSTHPLQPFTTELTSVKSNVTNAPAPIATEPRPISQEHQPTPIAPPSNTTNTTSLTPPTTPPQASSDHVVQTALTSVLNSPTQMQKLLTALAAHSISPGVFSSTTQPHHRQHLIAPSSYNNSSQQYTPGINSASGYVQRNATTSPRPPSTLDYTAANASSPFTPSLFRDLPNPHPFPPQQQEERPQNTHRSTAEISNDADELQSNIQSLIKSLGIDPTTLDSVLPATETGTGVGGEGSTSALSLSSGDLGVFPPVGTGTGQDFDFDSFLTDVPHANEEDVVLDKLAERLDPSPVVVPKVSDPSKIGSASSEQLHCLLDKGTSQEGSEGSVGGGGMGTGVPLLGGMPAIRVPSGAANGVPEAVTGVGAGMEAGTRTRERKRKSDAVADGAPTDVPPGGRTPISTTAAKPLTTGGKRKRKR